MSPEIKAMLDEDFEKGLTFLASQNPWLSESANLRNKALYLELTHFLRLFLSETCLNPTVWMINKPPMWLEALITYWHENKCTVITLNYDTLVERVASGTYWHKRSTQIYTGDLYPIDLICAGERRLTLLHEQPIDTFRLYKLHGSINWFYSGQSSFFGESLYYVPCEGGVDSLFLQSSSQSPENIHWTHVSDKFSLIIPPTLDKNAFFQHESLRSMWFQASKAINNASKIVCMGYSLPAGDLTMSQFIRTSAPREPVTFEIVDAGPRKDHFEKIVGKGTYKFVQNYTGIGTIPKFVIERCVSEETDKAHVVRFTNWNAETDG